MTDQPGRELSMDENNKVGSTSLLAEDPRTGKRSSRTNFSQTTRLSWQKSIETESWRKW